MFNHSIEREIKNPIYIYQKITTQILRSIQIQKLKTYYNILRSFWGYSFKYINRLSDDISKWTCYSTKKSQYLDQESIIENSQNQNLIIDTSSDAIQKISGKDNIKNNGNGSATNINLQFQNNQTQINQNKIKINVQLIDGQIQRQFSGNFFMSDTLETIANTILAYIGITNEIASCDLTIFNQNYNNPSKREKTLHQLSIKNDLTIEARLRWIGGR